ncbi:hypothetical protein [Vibrio ostreae]|uniref:Uncharacterized protein n=1 Tax=Vibrio ostreae TaxID=2841925 RepID=A0A975UDN7_9VIBR|nr:hypothetical protein [Vibrio ostreae]QXO19032.1 hypothetical protein KNV97_12580 [Vibrio ostreae]
MYKVKDEGYTPLFLAGLFVAVMLYELLVQDGSAWLWIPTLLLAGVTASLTYVVHWHRQHQGGGE